jgi:hypothetical protein
MLPTVISFYTPNWLYSDHAKRLTRECELLGLDYLIEERPDAGDYLANCRQKPAFIAYALRKLDRPVLWIDVDGSIYRRPDLLDAPGVDFAAKRKPSNCTRIWHVCALYFTPNALPFVDAWVAATSQWSDESALDEMWKSGVTLPAMELPDEYHHILNDGPQPKNTVIAHRLSQSDQKREFNRQQRRAG